MLLIVLRSLSREVKELLRLVMSVQEEQTKKFIVDTFHGAEDGGEDADIAIVSTHRVIAPYTGGFVQRFVDLVRVRASEAAVLIRICRNAPPRMRSSESQITSSSVSALRCWR